MTDPCKLALVKLPHPLNPSSCEVYPRFPEPGELSKVPFISCVRLAVRHTLKIIAVVKTALYI